VRVSGGMVRAKAAVSKLKPDNPDVQAGVNIVLRALEAPIRPIAEGSIVVGKITEKTNFCYCEYLIKTPEG
jgi:chaperonin GroEL